MNIFLRNHCRGKQWTADDVRLCSFQYTHDRAFSPSKAAARNEALCSTDKLITLRSKNATLPQTTLEGEAT